MLPEEAKLHANSVVVGEAEYLWQSLLTDVENHCLKPFYHSERKVSLADSPIPRFDLCKSGNYNMVWMQMSRGCPHDCEYCTASKIFGKRFRNKDLSQVINEIQLVKNLFPESRIAFADDNILVNKRLLQPLLAELSQLDIRWHAQTDISIGKDGKLLELFRKSGCTFLFIGLESLSVEGLSSIDESGWKANQLKNYSRYIQNIQSLGIGVMGAFMIGLDSDDLSSLKRIEDFIIENNLYAASITILTPLPGTRLRRRLEAEGRILSSKWGDYTGYNVNHLPKGMTVQELETGFVDTYERIYSKDFYVKKMMYFKQIQKQLATASA